MATNKRNTGPSNGKNTLTLIKGDKLSQKQLNQLQDLMDDNRLSYNNLNKNKNKVRPLEKQIKNEPDMKKSSGGKLTTGFKGPVESKAPRIQISGLDTLTTKLNQLTDNQNKMNNVIGQLAQTSFGKKPVGHTNKVIITDVTKNLKHRNKHLEKEWKKHRKSLNKKHGFPVSRYAAHVLDPMKYPPMRIPDTIIVESAVIGMRIFTALDPRPVILSTMSLEPGADTTMGYIAAIVLGAGIDGSKNLFGTLPPKTISGITGMVCGLTTSGAPQVVYGNILDGMNYLQTVPLSDVNGVIANWRMISGCCGIVDETPLLTRSGDWTAFAFPSGQLDDIFPSNDLPYVKLQNFFPNSGQGTLVESNPYTVWYPSDKMVYQYSSPLDADEPNVSAHGGCGFIVSWPGTSVPVDRMMGYTQVVLECQPQNNQLQFLDLGLSFCDFEAWQNALNLISTQVQIHTKKSTSVGMMTNSRRPNVRKFNNITDTPSYFKVHRSVNLETGEAKLVSMSEGLGITNADIHGTYNNVRSTVDKVLGYVDKYSGPVLDVLGALLA